MRSMEKKAGLILGGIFLFSLVLVGVVMAVTQATTATVTVNEFLSVTLTSGSPITFGGIDPLATGKPTTDPLVATIGAETNVGSIFVKTKADGTDFCTDYPTCTGSGGEFTFAVSNLEWSATDFSGTDYTTSDATVCSGKGASDTCNIYHELTIPSAQAADSYSIGITIAATTTP